ncbi:MAG: protein kinase, partial [Planctomycetota bacterium]
NVLVTEVDGNPVPKVIDFGIAKAIQGRLTDATLHTQHGLMVGTPGYMSPEQADAGDLDLDTRTDVYSLGVILYELLAGRQPFERGELEAAGIEGIHRLIREVEPPRPSRAAAMPTVGGDETITARLLRGDLDWIVMRCLEKDRSRRYASASDVSKELTRYLRNEPIDAGPPTAGYRLRKFARRHRLGVGLTAAAALTIIGVTITLAVLLSETRQARADAEDQAAIAASINQFLTDDILGSVGGRGVRRVGQNVTLRQVLDNSSEFVVDRFNDQPRVKAGVHLALGKTYGEMGEYESATLHIDAALNLLDGLVDEDDADLLEALYTSARLRRQQWDLSGAAELLDRLEPQVATLPKTDPRTTRHALEKAALHEARGEYEAAQAGYADAAEDLGRLHGAGSRSQLNARSRSGLMLVRLDQLDAARAELTTAHDGLAALFDPMHPDRLIARRNLAELELAEADRLTGDASDAYAAVLATLEEIIVQQITITALDHPQTRRTGYLIAITQLNLGRRTEALDLVTANIKWAREHLAPNHAFLTNNHILKAQIALMLGRTREAEAALNAAEQALADPELQTPAARKATAEIKELRARLKE